jgi:thioredoxin 1
MMLVTEKDLLGLLDSERPVLVEFFASWCPPCRRIAPVLDQLAQDYRGRAIFAKIDTDENPAVTATFGINALPTLVFFRGGRETDRMVGIQAPEKISRALGLANISEADFQQR